MKLRPQPWIEDAGAQAILGALDVAGGTTRLVGGAVRDALLGLPLADIDLATRLKPEAVIDRLQQAGLKTVPTGIDHGTVTVIAPGLAMEVTTLRRDVSTDGRRATVAFTDDWREDAARRDFTINALSANPLTGEVFDYFGGIADLERHHVRFIGAPRDRIAEDHLRILRFFRFHARFGEGAPDAEGLAACAARANDLMALSRERIRDELLKLLLAPDPVPTIRLMLGHGILKPVLPEIIDAGIEKLQALTAAERDAGIEADAIRRLAALLPPDPDLADTISRRLKLSNAERKRLSTAAARSTSDMALSAEVLAYRIGRDEAVDRLLLAGAGPQTVRALACWQRPRLPLGGGDLVERGISRGPAVSAMLRAIEDDWVDAGFPADPLVLEQIVKRRLGTAGV